MDTINAETTEMPATNNDAAAALPRADPTAGTTSSLHILVAHRVKKGYLLQRVQIGLTTSGSEAMVLLKKTLPWRHRHAALLFKQDVETGQLSRVPTFTPMRDEVEVFPSNRKFELYLTRALANPTILDEEFNDGRPFATAYSELLACSNSPKILIIDTRLRQSAKFALIMLALLISLAMGLIAGFAAMDLKTGVAVGCTPIPMILFVGTITWKGKKRLMR